MFTGISRNITRWILSCPYRVRASRAVSRREKVRQAMMKPTRYLTKKFGLRLESLEKLLYQLGGQAQKVVDTAKEFRNPLTDLELDENSGNALNVVLRCCSLPRPVPFWIAVPFWKQANAVKLAAGSYGEVYSTHNTAKEARILKFIPVNGRHPNSEYSPNVTFSQVLPDVICSKYLSRLNEERDGYKAPCFPTLVSMNLVKGKFPGLLTKAWVNYEEQAEKTESPPFPRPDGYDADQFFISIETENCGVNIIPSEYDIFECMSLFCQAVSTLAVAECAYQFEHRDLHRGNILVRPTSQTSLEFCLDGVPFEVDTFGCHLFIIDFTMSRITVDNKTYFMDMGQRPLSPFTIDEKLFNWLNHELMYSLSAMECRRNYTSLDSPLSTSACMDWSIFCPRNNVYWLRYLLENMTQCLEGREDISREELKIARTFIKWRSELMPCDSATTFLEKVLLDRCPIIRTR